MNIQTYLNRAFYLDRLIKANQDELQHLKATKDAITSLDTTQDYITTNHTTDKTANTITKIIDLENQIQTDIDNYIQTKINIKKMIDQIEKPKLKLLLQERYLNFKKWEQIRQTLQITDLRYIFRLHKTALKQLKTNQTKHQNDHTNTTHNT